MLRRCSSSMLPVWRCFRGPVDSCPLAPVTFRKSSEAPTVLVPWYIRVATDGSTSDSYIRVATDGVQCGGVDVAFPPGPGRVLFPESCPRTHRRGGEGGGEPNSPAVASPHRFDARRTPPGTPPAPPPPPPPAPPPPPPSPPAPPPPGPPQPTAWACCRACPPRLMLCRAGAPPPCARPAPPPPPPPPPIELWRARAASSPGARLCRAVRTGANGTCPPGSRAGSLARRNSSWMACASEYVFIYIHIDIL
jgi:hypothetical protein